MQIEEARRNLDRLLNEMEAAFLQAGAKASLEQTESAVVRLSQELQQLEDLHTPALRSGLELCGAKGLTLLEWLAKACFLAISQILAARC